MAHNMTKNTKNIKNVKNVKMHFVKNMSFLKVSGQTVSIAVFGVFFYIGLNVSKIFFDIFENMLNKC